jgi:hypothetical protein
LFQPVTALARSAQRFYVMLPGFSSDVVRSWRTQETGSTAVSVIFLLTRYRRQAFLDISRYIRSQIPSAWVLSPQSPLFGKFIAPFLYGKIDATRASIPYVFIIKGFYGKRDISSAGTMKVCAYRSNRRCRIITTPASEKSVLEPPEEIFGLKLRRVWERMDCRQVKEAL